MDRQKAHRWPILFSVAAIVVGSSLAFRFLKTGSSWSPPGGVTTPLDSSGKGATVPSNSFALPQAAGSSRSTDLPLDAEAPFSGAIEKALKRLSEQTDAEQSILLLETLKKQLMKSDSKEQSVAAILGFLRSGRDANTGLAFRVGPNHALAEAPTLRSVLLDWLGQLDRVAAADFAQSIFEAMSSPEEYALALRNFARGRPDERGALRAHFNRLLTHAPWATQPSPGFLEAFDVVPHLGDSAFIDPLSALLAHSTEASLRHASLVALDRLVLANPADSVTGLAMTDQLNDQPLVRASFLARADIRDPRQRQTVEAYLLSPALSDREADKFVGLFPNVNRFVSHNLLTESGGRSLAEIAAQDAATLEQVRGWMQEPRFARLLPRLEQLAKRLQRHVDSAVRGGYRPRQRMGAP